jgi:hypothetical protein
MSSRHEDYGVQFDGKGRPVEVKDVFKWWMAHDSHALSSPLCFLQNAGGVISKGATAKIHMEIFGNEDGRCQYLGVWYDSLDSCLKTNNVRQFTTNLWRYVFYKGKPLEYWRQILIELRQPVFRRQYANKCCTHYKGKKLGEPYDDWLESYLKKCGLLGWRQSKPTQPSKKAATKKTLKAHVHKRNHEEFVRAEKFELNLKRKSSLELFTELEDELLNEDELLELLACSKKQRVDYPSTDILSHLWGDDEEGCNSVEEDFNLEEDSEEFEPAGNFELNLKRKSSLELFTELEEACSKKQRVDYPSTDVLSHLRGDDEEGCNSVEEDFNKDGWWDNFFPSLRRP